MGNTTSNEQWHYLKTERKSKDDINAWGDLIQKRTEFNKAMEEL